MNDLECTQIYNRLVNILDEKGLSWVTAQVEEEIRIGQTIPREIETLSEGKAVPSLHMFEEDYSSRLRKGPKATFPDTVPYQPSEQLELLIRAVEQTVVSTAEMEHELVNFLERDERTPKKIEFYAPDPSIEPTSITRQTVGTRLVRARRLQGLLESLRKEISK